MPLVYAASASHAPGITAWVEGAPTEKKDKIYGAFADLRAGLVASKADVAVIVAPEHFANFFLNNMPAFCIGRGAHHMGPVEPWLRIERRPIPGDPVFAETLLNGCYEHGFEPSYSDELEVDHGVALPVHFLIPDGSIPIVPVIINCLTEPMPSAARCFAFGEAIAAIAANSDRRVAVIGTGGLSHWPGEAEHGTINEEFDATFLKDVLANDGAALQRYTHEQIAESGTGGHEVRAWIIVAGAVAGWKPELLTYQPVHEWATGCGFVHYQQAA